MVYKVVLSITFLVLISCQTSSQKINSYSDYEVLTSETKAHLLSLDIGDFDMSIERAENGRETVASIAKRTNADIAINAGFFHESGAPAGVLKVSGELISCGLNKVRGSLMWEDDKILTDRVFCQDTNLVSDLGTFPSEYSNIVGGVPLILFNGENVLDNDIEKAYDAFIKNRYARTAIGISNSKLFILIVEGSSSLEKKEGIRKGYSIKELADLFIEKKCNYAVNLDGGGSTTLVIDGEVKNKLETERPVSEAIVFKRKR
ncbi:MAG: phosphodiester glycosidase family protein [Oligoflexales bacterium]|nr:phosphodiester glycosidase family protein [Oligoflexales bacterium]